MGGTTTQTSHTLGSADVGHTLRAEVKATNAAGSVTVRSAKTGVVQPRTTGPAPAPAGCGKKGGTVPVSAVASPARLTIDQIQSRPGMIGFGSRLITTRFHVAACGGSVQGALVYATAIPYGQFAVPPEATTDAGGWATVQLAAMPGFPVTTKQRLLVMFVRARKAGEDLLGGISTRRLVSFPVRP